jgi:general L-amino acid transport system permease protein
MQNQIGAPKGFPLAIHVCARGCSRSSRLFRGRSGLVPVHNTQTNLQHRGITSGFDFLERSAGFGIAQHLILHRIGQLCPGVRHRPAQHPAGDLHRRHPGDDLGFIIGVARLSPNWMINKLATVYVETFRNIPPLLQILFWYFAVFLTMPGPRGSINFDDTFFISSRGLNMPAPRWPTVSGRLSWRGGGHRGHRADGALGQQALRRDRRAVPQVLGGLALFIVIPALCALLRQPAALGMPQLKGFNFVGGWVLIPELLALTLALTIYTAAFIAEIVRSGIRSVSHGQTEAARSLGLREGPTLRKVIIPRRCG